ncbi:MAG: flagellar hook protein FlgE, partial [Campylobacter sp.]
MMRSLWSGVSGMQAHQIAIDVEGNNIANVNTAGFKYSRANFSDILSQTPRVATAPQGELGGQNAMQIGLGTSINSTTRIFSQGTLTSTDKNTDLALQGNGFFVVSPDGGTTRYYTRNGDFLRDKAGNFVNESGHIVQGWTRDEETGTIDTTAPIKNIVIKEGLTTPARATKEMKVKGNLDSGNAIGNRSTPIYSLDSVTGGRDFDGDDLRSNSEIHSENDVNANEFYTNAKNEQVLTERGVDLGVTFNELGNGLALRDGQGIWVSYANAVTKNPFQIGSANPANIGQFTSPSRRTLNITLNNTTITATVNNISEVAAAINAQYNNTGVRAEISEGYKLTLINRNNSGTTANTKNIHLVVNGTDSTGMLAQTPGGTGTLNIITAYQYKYNSSSVTANHQANDGIARSVHTTEDLRAAIQKDMRAYVDYNGDGMLGGAAIGTVPSLTAGEAILAASDAAKLATNKYNAAYNEAINSGLGVAAAETAGKAAASTALGTLSSLAYKTAYDAATTHTAGLAAIRAMVDMTDLNDGAKLTVNKQGQYQLENPASGVADQPIYMTVTGLTQEASGGG